VTPAQRQLHTVLAYVLGFIMTMVFILDGFGLGFVVLLTLTVGNIVIPYEYARRRR
jgi:hypothetical protein